MRITTSKPWHCSRSRGWSRYQRSPDIWGYLYRCTSMRASGSPLTKSSNWFLTTTTNFLSESNSSRNMNSTITSSRDSETLVSRPTRLFKDHAINMSMIMLKSRKAFCSRHLTLPICMGGPIIYLTCQGAETCGANTSTHGSSPKMWKMFQAHFSQSPALFMSQPIGRIDSI